VTRLSNEGESKRKRNYSASCLFVCLFVYLFVCLFVFFSFIHSFVYNSGAKVAAVVMKLTEYVGNGYEMMLFDFRQNLAKK